MERPRQQHEECTVVLKQVRLYMCENSYQILINLACPRTQPRLCSSSLKRMAHFQWCLNKWWLQPNNQVKEAIHTPAALFWLYTNEVRCIWHVIRVRYTESYKICTHWWYIVSHQYTSSLIGVVLHRLDGHDLQEGELMILETVLGSLLRKRKFLDHTKDVRWVRMLNLGNRSEYAYLCNTSLYTSNKPVRYGKPIILGNLYWTCRQSTVALTLIDMHQVVRHRRK